LEAVVTVRDARWRRRQSAREDYERRVIAQALARRVRNAAAEARRRGAIIRFVIESALDDGVDLRVLQTPAGPLVSAAAPCARTPAIRAASEQSFQRATAEHALAILLATAEPEGRA
jgi:hypothetical protein